MWQKRGVCKGAVGRIFETAGELGLVGVGELGAKSKTQGLGVGREKQKPRRNSPLQPLEAALGSLISGSRSLPTLAKESHTEH